MFCCIADTWCKRWWWYFENICCHALWNVDLLMCLVGYSWLVITRILLSRHMWQWSFFKYVQRKYSALCFVMKTPYWSVVHIMHVRWSLLDVMVFGGMLLPALFIINSDKSSRLELECLQPINFHSNLIPKFIPLLQCYEIDVHFISNHTRIIVYISYCP